MNRLCRRLAPLAAGIALFSFAAVSQAQKPNPDFKIVAEKLDQDGDLYVYMELRGIVDEILDNVDGLIRTFSQDRNAAMVPAMGRAIVKALGLDQLDDFGMSSVSLGEGMTRTKTYLRFREPVGLFSMLAAPGESPDSARYLPQDAAFAAAKKVRLEGLLPLVNRIASAVAGAAGEAKVREILDQVKRSKGADIQAAMDLLGDETGFWIRFDELNQVTIKDGAKEVRIPKPSFALLVKTKKAGILDEVAKMGKPGEAKVEKVGEDGADLKFPVKPNPLEFKPLLAQRGEWMILASSPDAVDASLAAAKDGKDVRSNPDFKRVAEGIPAKVTAFAFASPKLGPTIVNVLEQLTAGDRNAEKVVGLLRPLARSKSGLVTWMVTDANGILWATQGEAAMRSAFAAAASPSGAVLAAIAVPNFLEAQTRSKVARVRSDQRSMATALESYFIDNNKYPVWTDKDAEYGKGAAFQGKMIPSFPAYKPGGAMTVTTPIAYMTSYFDDVFAPVEKTTFGYYGVTGSKTAGWVIFSPGPDQKYDLDWKLYNPDVTQPSPELVPFIYDPTNGTVSPGDIIRVKQ